MNLSKYTNRNIETLSRVQNQKYARVILFKEE